MDPENGRSTPFWTSCERQRHGDFIAGTVVIQCAPTNLSTSPDSRWFQASFVECKAQHAHEQHIQTKIPRENQDRVIRVKIIPVKMPPTQPRLSHNGRGCKGPPNGGAGP